MVMDVIRKRISKLRLNILTNRLKSIGNHVELDSSIKLVFPDNIEMGNHIYIGPGAYLNGRGGLIIHDHVIIAPDIAVMTSMHRYKDAEMLPYDHYELLMPVVIERCVWIGMRVIIMPGVTIGEGSVVGAGSVVTKSCEPGSIIGGNPARKIGTRDMNHYNNCIEKNKFYLQIKQEKQLQKLEVLSK